MQNEADFPGDFFRTPCRKTVVLLIKFAKQTFSTHFFTPNSGQTLPVCNPEINRQQHQKPFIDCLGFFDKSGGGGCDHFALGLSSCLLLLFVIVCDFVTQREADTTTPQSNNLFIL